MSCDLHTLQEQAEALNKMRAQIFKERIDQLVGVYGSLRSVSRALNIDCAYLHRLQTGEKANPSAAVLRKLGLK